MPADHMTSAAPAQVSASASASAPAPTLVSESVPEGEPGVRGTVAFLGPVASFTHQAMLQDFPEGSGYEYLPCPTIKDIFEAVSTSAATHGVVPFENSTYGPVVDTLDLLATAPHAYANLDVVAESYIAVHHALVGRLPPEARPGTDSASSADSTIPGAGAGAPVAAAPLLAEHHHHTPLSSGTATPTLETPTPTKPRARPHVPLTHVRRVLSHPQAFGQCASFLATYLRHAERQETASTAAAAARVAAHPGIDEAAIASVAAARSRGLDILAEQIEDQAGNRTRFLTLRRQAAAATTTARIDEVAAAAVGNNASTLVPRVPPAPGHDVQYKTLVSFTLPPAAAPGALAGALAAFTAHALGLTSIHARPSGMRAWHYVWVAECAGGGPGDARVPAAMAALRRATEACACHGSYVARAREGE